MLPFIAAAGFCALLLPAPSNAQGLAEAAAKEKARRKALAPGKVYTEDDLRRAGGGSTTSSAPTTEPSPSPAGDAAGQKADPAAPSKEAPKAKTDDELRAEKEKSWRDRLTKTNEQIGQLSSEISSLEALLGDPSQSIYGPNRAAQLAQLDESKSKLSAAQRTLSDLQDEGRRNGFRQ
jgi:hypothetical protein